jgi:hypothetical protein
MNEIEQKALELVNEVTGESVSRIAHASHYDLQLTLCRAIEQHEAFKQEVGDALLWYFGSKEGCVSDALREFIIPKPKPDPLVEALIDFGWSDALEASKDAELLNAALEARGLEIRSKNDD